VLFIVFKGVADVKKLGFGLMRLPLTDGDYKNVNQELAAKMVDYFLEQGFTYFDTAYVYHMGNSEATVKKALSSRHERETFIIADKMPAWLVREPEDYQRLFDEQLERCGVDYFDYYLLQNLCVKSYTAALKHGGFEFLKKIKAEGNARSVGFSFHDKAAILDRILNEQPEVDFVQLQINYIDWDSEAIQSCLCYETALRHNVSVIVTEPVKGGCLAALPEEADKLLKAFNPAASASSWAIRFAASLPNVLVVLSGMSSLEQMRDNTRYMSSFKPINASEEKIIRKVTEIINRNIAIPCTACAYCVDGCPQKIAIPQYFSLYASQKQFGLTPSQMAYYASLSGEFGKASACIACKQCEEYCPQHIAISDQLKEVAKIFEKT
jgi:predicted aldo/keto reductase-like oxidoreductase